MMRHYVSGSKFFTLHSSLSYGKPPTAKHPIYVLAKAILKLAKADLKLAKADCFSSIKK
jgi:hypothetical protein